MTKRTLILGGGTIENIRPHFAFCAPAYGGTARRLKQRLPDAELCLTKMAGGELETNQDVSDFVDEMISELSVHVVYFNIALCDFTTSSIETGLDKARLESRNELETLSLEPTLKIIEKIRKYRKDIFLVGFKATSGASEDEMYAKGLRLLKSASCNIVLVNDVHTKLNMIVVPEEARYCVTDNRVVALDNLVSIVNARSKLTYVRSVVKSLETTPWKEMPEQLRRVVDYCVEKGAYKPFRGKTSGHFAYHDRKNGVVYASRRKSNYNETRSMIRCKPRLDGSIDVFGGKASVGAQTQRIIFEWHPDVDFIVHFHCPLRPGIEFPTVEQFAFECGSMECASNTLSGMEEFSNGVKAVMLKNHGPNIAFNKDTDPDYVIRIIEHHFDLSAKTGGLILDI